MITFNNILLYIVIGIFAFLGALLFWALFRDNKVETKEDLEQAIGDTNEN